MTFEIKPSWYSDQLERPDRLGAANFKRDGVLGDLLQRPTSVPTPQTPTPQQSDASEDLTSALIPGMGG